MDQMMSMSLEAASTVGVAYCSRAHFDPDIAGVASKQAGPHDDLSRNVYGLLGIPLDADNFQGAICSLNEAIDNRRFCLLSTVNVDYLSNSMKDAEFRESLLRSDLCTADGFPVVWLARLMGVPLRERVAGSDVFMVLKNNGQWSSRPRFFLFGGDDGVAAAAARSLNHETGATSCVGYYNPGFVSVEEMSSDRILELINASDADFLVVALGSVKGQAWLLRNHERLRIPVRAHLGATLNFEAGTVERAPRFFQDWGMEWLWRIKEEPYLWRRYFQNLLFLLRVLMTQVAPLMLATRLGSHRGGGLDSHLHIEAIEREHDLVVELAGSATSDHISVVMDSFRSALAHNKNITIDLKKTHAIDLRFFGLLLMLRKQLTERGSSLTVQEASPALRRIFRLNGFSYLLAPDSK
ncbi:MAG: WecB/TagA/CpsF family glycosyltransferase [Blastochloris sp.]|nr:WecB/TagA/CpsF family glycosyltransferase [Blastochloris sp.]